MESRRIPGYPVGTLESEIFGGMKDTLPLMKFRYQIDVWYENGWYLAEIWAGANHCVTQGRNEEEIWYMIADAILTMNDVKISWWNKLINKFFKY